MSYAERLLRERSTWVWGAVAACAGMGCAAAWYTRETWEPWLVALVGAAARSMATDEVTGRVWRSIKGLWRAEPLILLEGPKMVDMVKGIEKLVADGMQLERDIQTKGLMASLGDVRVFLDDLDALGQAVLPAPQADVIGKTTI